MRKGGGGAQENPYTLQHPPLNPQGFSVSTRNQGQRLGKAHSWALPAPSLSLSLCVPFLPPPLPHGSPILQLKTSLNSNLPSQLTRETFILNYILTYKHILYNINTERVICLRISHLKQEDVFGQRDSATYHGSHGVETGWSTGPQGKAPCIPHAPGSQPSSLLLTAASPTSTRALSAATCLQVPHLRAATLKQTPQGDLMIRVTNIYRACTCDKQR